MIKHNRKWFVVLLALWFTPTWGQNVDCNDGPIKVVKKWTKPATTSSHVAGRHHVKRHAKTTLFAQNSGIEIIDKVGEVFGNNGHSVSLGQKLAVNDLLQTGKDSFLSLRLDDGSVSVLEPNSKLVISRVTRPVTYDLVSGKIQNRVNKAKDQNTPVKFKIRVPRVSIGARGTFFWVDYDASKQEGTMLVEEGTVQVVRRGDESVSLMRTSKNGTVEQINDAAPCAAPVWLHAGEGTSLNVNQLAARPLMDAPQMLEPTKIQRDAMLHFDFKPVAGATKYVLQIATDEAFVHMRKVVYITGTSVDVDDTGLSDGFYFARLAAFDAMGLQGKSEEYLYFRNRRGSK